MRFVALLLVPVALLAGPSRYARLGDFQGSVQVQLSAADPWIPAERNLPLTESAWVLTGPRAYVEIELDDGAAWRLGPDSQGEISDYTRLSTGQRVTLLSLDHGTAYYTGQPLGKDVVMVVMPGAQVTVLEGSRIRQTVQGAWSQVAVLEGHVRFSAPAAEMDVREGATARVEPANPSRFFLYPEVVAEPLDQWSEERDKLQSAPVSGTHVTARYGLTDLDSAGKWLHTNDLGLVWRPEVAPDWVPYRKGRWRYYPSLGYTWVSDDAWGWVPYHNGRWARKDDIGWVWQPAVSSVFRPGEVYWLRGEGFAGWGPLAAGERETAATSAVAFAPFQPDVRTLDPDGFAAPTAEQVKLAKLVPALPSPAFLASSLDATRPVLRVGTTRVLPSVPLVQYGDDPLPDTEPVTEQPPRPVPLAGAAATTTDPPPDAVQTVAVPVVEPWPVIVNPPAPKELAASKVTAPAKPAEPPARHIPKDPSTALSTEREMYKQVLEDIKPGAPNFALALADLNAVAAKFPTSTLPNERAYYYVMVYNGLSRPEKGLESATPLVTAGVSNAFTDQERVLQVLVNSTTALTQIKAVSAPQMAAGQQAAKQLLDFLPVYFAPRRKPADVSDAAWSMARTNLETLAKQALEKRPTGKTAPR